MQMWEIILLFAAGILAGILNAIAGGATFFTFPALIYKEKHHEITIPRNSNTRRRHGL